MEGNTTGARAAKAFARYSSAAVLVLGLGAASAAAETDPVDPASLTDQIITVMSQERAALSALGGQRLAELSGQALPAGPNGDDGAAVDLAALDDQDARAASGAERVQMTAAQFNAELPRAFDVATLDRLAPVEGGEQWACLREALYFEARGEPLQGQIAVAEVILNRVDDSRYPNSICGVTRQGVNSPGPCQFSYNCNGRANTMGNAQLRERMGKLAMVMMEGRSRHLTDGATHFHARYVNPAWSRTLTRTASIGQHIFYRYPTRLVQR